MTHLRPRWFAPEALAFALAFAGCDEPRDEVDTVVADRTAHCMVAQTNFALAAEVFSFPFQLAIEDAADGPRRAVELLRDRLLALDLGCEPELVLGDDSIVARFGDCKVGMLRFSGEVEASVAIETGAGVCPSGECPTALIWTIDDFDLQLGNDDANRPHLSGPLQLRDSIDPSEPMSWTTLDGFVLENRLGTFETRSHATWNLDSEACVTFTLESQLDILAPREDGSRDEREIGTIVLRAEGLHRCPGQCPDAGRVRLAFGAGRLLEWTYGGTPDEGDEDVEVLGPRGRRFLQRLQCR